MAVQAVDKNRVIRRRRVDQRRSRQRIGRPIFMVPLSAQNPTAFWQLRCKRLDPGNKLRRCSASRRIDRRKLRSRLHKMHMSIVKPRNNEVRPSCAMTRVFAPISDLVSASEPTATILPFMTASDLATFRFESIVRMLALVMTRSAAAVCPRAEPAIEHNTITAVNN